MTMSRLCRAKAWIGVCVLLSFLEQKPCAAQQTASIPTWDELDARPLPEWYDQAKFGIFLHWGLFSVPSYGSEWFWRNWKGDDATADNEDPNNPYARFVQDTERPHFHYPEYAPRFRAELYRPQEWAQALAQSGAQYVVLTSKHHDGFCNWNSRNVTSTWNWNVMDVGPKRDLLGDLAKEVRKVQSPQTHRTLKFGVYHSLYEWYNPMYRRDRENQFQTQQFVTNKALPELYDLVEQYQPDLIWSDGDWEAYSDYWRSREFLSWYANQSSVASTAVWNDRWGMDAVCHHGSFVTCQDRFNPDVYQARKFENALTIDKGSWGFNRNSTNLSMYMTVQEIIHTLVQVVALNGNMLLNVGPNADGTIDPIFLDRLHGVGTWLNVNGEAIYSTQPWNVCQNETSSSVFYTKKEDRLYAIFLQWPSNNLLLLNCVTATDSTQVRFLGLDDGRIAWRMRESLHDSQPKQQRNTAFTNIQSTAGIEVMLPALTPNIIPCEYAWALEITGVVGVHSPRSEESNGRVD